MHSYEISPAFVTATAQRFNEDGSIEFHLYNPARSAVHAEIRKNGEMLRCLKISPEAICNINFRADEIRKE